MGPYVLVAAGADLDGPAAELVRHGWRLHRGVRPPDEPWDLGPARLVVVAELPDLAAAQAALLCAVRGAGLLVALDPAAPWAAGFRADLHRLAPDRPAGAGPTAAGQTAAGRTGARQTGARQTGAGLTGAGLTSAEPVGVGPAGAGLTSAGLTGAGSAGAGQAGAGQADAGQADAGQADAGRFAAAAGAAGGRGALTADQRDVLELLAAGNSIAQAARLRFLSLRTANRRVAEARDVLGVATTREAVLAYVRLRDRS